MGLISALPTKTVPVATDALVGTDSDDNSTKQITIDALLIPANERIVSATGVASARTLSAALAAITDATANNRYRIRVIGDIAETAQIVAKSHIDVVADSPVTITVTDTTGGSGHAALSMTDIEDCLWHNINLVRAGTLTGAGNSNTDVLYATSAAASTAAAPHPVFRNCVFRNSVVNGGSVTHCTGVNLLDYAGPTFEACSITGGDVQYGYGLLLNDYANPQVFGGHIIGGDAANAHGLVTTYSATGTFVGVIIEGSATTGTAAHGLQALRGSRPEFVGCDFRANKAGSYAIACQSVSAPRITGGRAVGAAIQTQDFVVALLGSCAPVIANLHIQPREVTIRIAYDDANNGRIQPSASTPYQLVSIDVDVVVAQTAGATLSIGTTVAGTEVVSGIALDVAAAYPDVVIATAGKAIFAAATYLYLTPSVAVADGAFEVHIVYAVAYGRNDGIYMATKGRALISGCTVETSGASNAVFVDTNGITSPQWLVFGCRLIARRTDSSFVCVQCASAMSNVPVHNCTVVGAAGSNVTSWQAATATYGTNTRV